ncbi:hypothetical protein GMD78_05955 [Ornithinibacillus sp. L9]|uniref:Uncharacterized protein n=1 Tax=Ornithinibacillus caprae TaxID=2678566 RepID=A0A6N8FFG6_9BACI|nr:hypothetical protein [Ornithinibacillus caprae]MUK87941.1 hypothetical protein [Ornithinibacillus caprae]
MKHRFLEQFYTIDPITGDYMIDISVQGYHDVFTSLKPSVYNIIDLNANIKSFLEDCMNDIPSHQKIALEFNMADEIKDVRMEKEIEEGIRNYFSFQLFLLDNEFITKRKRMVLYISVSFLFTVPSIFFQTLQHDEILWKLFILSLTVGGWIFLWEAFSLLFIDRSKVLKKRKQYKRIVHASILFNYKKQIGKTGKGVVISYRKKGDRL